MPTLDKLAESGLRYNNFHTTALCSPTRAALKSGRNHHTVNMGFITEMATGMPGNTGQIPNSTAPLAEMLRLNGYSTAAFGKWHETASWEISVSGPFDRWPLRQGFDKFYGFFGGETNQWAPLIYDGVTQVELPNDPSYHFMTDMTDKARAWIKHQKAMTPDKPSFVYFAPGATHAPHHVPKEWIAKWKGKFDMGWDKLREQSLARQITMGVVPPGTKLAPKPPEIKDWDKLSADEKRLFTRQAEVFAAFAEYTDHEIGRMLKAFEEVGDADNTLVFYIAGDNGTSGEGGQNGMFSEMTYFNGVQEKVEDMLKLIDQWGGPETYPHMAAGWAVALDAPFALDETGAFGLRRHAQRHGRALAERHQGEERDPHPVRPRDRRRTDGAAGDRPARAQGRQRREADSDGRHQPHVFVRRRQGQGAPHHAVLRGRRQPRDLPRRLVCANDPQGAVGNQAAPRAGGQLGLAAVRRALRLQPGQRPRVEGSEETRRDAGAVSAGSPQVRRAADGRPRVRAVGRRRSRPSRPDGRAHFDHAVRGHDRHDGVGLPNVKNRSKTITAEIEVPASGGNGTLIAQGGRFGGWSLYVKDGVPAYDYNFLGMQRTSIAAAAPLAPGSHTVRFEFAYDGGGPAKGGTGTLLVDGRKVAEGRIPATQPGIFSADETADVGIDLGTPVVEAIGAEAKSRFTGRIPKLVVETM